MGISLQKGGNISLSKVEPGLRSVQIGLGWAEGLYDIDASAFLLAGNGKVRSDADFIFYNQPESSDGSVRHLGDNRSGVGEGDDEMLKVQLEQVPPALERIVFAVTLHEAVERGYDFSQVRDGYIRVLGIGDKELVRFDLGTLGAETALIVGELYRHQGEWKFRAIGQGFAGGLGPLASHFGVGVNEAPPAAPPPSIPPPAPTLLTPPPPPPVPPPPPPAPMRVRLSKPGASQAMAMASNTQAVRITATWVDNGDASANNDDLDLRAGILWPDGRFEMVHCNALGHLDKRPFIKHGGDVQVGSKAQPGSENMQLNPAISRHAGGPVAVVFSVYSAVSNGAVSINTLQPSMRIEHGANQVHCQLDWNPKEDRKEWIGVYTYVLGMVIIRGDTLQIIQGGQKSAKGSESTPLLKWTSPGEVSLSIDGPHLFK